MYTIRFVVRFQGTLTQGPNKGKTYSLQNSWGGRMFDTLTEAQQVVLTYQKLEPELQFHVYQQTYNEKTGKMVEVEV